MDLRNGNWTLKRGADETMQLHFSIQSDAMLDLQLKRSRRERAGRRPAASGSGDYLGRALVRCLVSVG